MTLCSITTHLHSSTDWSSPGLSSAKLNDVLHRHLTMYLNQNQLYCGWPISDFTAGSGSGRDDET
jgi:hypothetical protein